MTEDVVILEPGDDRAQKIGKALANRTANDIIAMLKSSEMTLSEISEKLGQPMTSTKYHVENLLDAGLIEVKKIKYSEKGREVKVYAASGQVVIVSPGVKDIRQILLKYASVFGIFLFAVLIMGVTASTVFSGMPLLKNAAPGENVESVYFNSVYVSSDDVPGSPYNTSNTGRSYLLSNNTGDVKDSKQISDQKYSATGGPLPQDIKQQYDQCTDGLNESDSVCTPMSAAETKQYVGAMADIHFSEPVRDNSPVYIIIGFLIGGATVIVCLALTEIYTANRTKRSKKD